MQTGEVVHIQRDGLGDRDGVRDVVAVLAGLVREGAIEKVTLLEAARQYRIDDVMAAPEPTTDPGVA